MRIRKSLRSDIFLTVSAVWELEELHVDHVIVSSLFLTLSLTFIPLGFLYGELKMCISFIVYASCYLSYYGDMLSRPY